MDDLNSGTDSSQTVTVTPRIVTLRSPHTSSRNLMRMSTVAEDKSPNNESSVTIPKPLSSSAIDNDIRLANIIASAIEKVVDLKMSSVELLLQKMDTIISTKSNEVITPSVSSKMFFTMSNLDLSAATEPLQIDSIVKDSNKVSKTVTIIENLNESFADSNKDKDKEKEKDNDKVDKENGKDKDKDKKEKKDKKPKEQKILELSYKINCVSDIDPVSCTFAIDIKCFMYWDDAKLIGRKNGVFINYEEEKGLFEPDIIVTNDHDLIEVVKDQNTKIVDPEKGSVKRTMHYKGTVFLGSMDLKLFPFDCQNLQICFKPYKLPKDELILVSKLKECAVDRTIMHEWNVLGHCVKPFFTDPATSSTNKSYSTLFVTVLARRKFQWHINNVFIPTAAFLIISWLTFLFGIAERSERNDMSLSTLLASISNKFVIGDAIPKVDYRTLLDVYLDFCFYLQMFTMVVTMVVYTFHENVMLATGLNWVFFIFEFTVCVLFHEWIYYKYLNHDIDVSHWVEAAKFLMLDANSKQVEEELSKRGIDISLSHSTRRGSAASVNGAIVGRDGEKISPNDFKMSPREALKLSQEATRNNNSSTSSSSSPSSSTIKTKSTGANTTEKNKQQDTKAVGGGYDTSLLDRAESSRSLMIASLESSKNLRKISYAIKLFQYCSKLTSDFGIALSDNWNEISSLIDDGSSLAALENEDHFIHFGENQITKSTEKVVEKVLMESRLISEKSKGVISQFKINRSSSKIVEAKSRIASELHTLTEEEKAKLLFEIDEARVVKVQNIWRKKMTAAKIKKLQEYRYSSCSRKIQKCFRTYIKRKHKRATNRLRLFRFICFVGFLLFVGGAYTAYFVIQDLWTQDVLFQQSWVKVGLAVIVVILFSFSRSRNNKKKSSKSSSISRSKSTDSSMGVNRTRSTSSVGGGKDAKKKRVSF